MDFSLAEKDKFLRLRFLLREKFSMDSQWGNPSKGILSMSFEVAHFHDKAILCEYRDALTVDDETVYLGYMLL